MLSDHCHAFSVPTSPRLNGAILHPFWVDPGSFWGTFGITLASFWHHFGSSGFIFSATQNVVDAHVTTGERCVCVCVCAEGEGVLYYFCETTPAHTRRRTAAHQEAASVCVCGGGGQRDTFSGVKPNQQQKSRCRQPSRNGKKNTAPPPRHAS